LPSAWRFAILSSVTVIGYYGGATTNEYQ